MRDPTIAVIPFRPGPIALVLYPRGVDEARLREELEAQSSGYEFVMVETTQDHVHRYLAAEPSRMLNDAEEN